MNKLFIFIFFAFIFTSFKSVTQLKKVNYSTNPEDISSQRISFKIKGTGSKNINVLIGVGYQPGSGACCTGVSNNTTVSFSGVVGDVVYDGKTKRIITKIYKDLNGTTINLYEYYWFFLLKISFKKDLNL